MHTLEQSEADMEMTNVENTKTGISNLAFSKPEGDIEHGELVYEHVIDEKQHRSFSDSWSKLSKSYDAAAEFSKKHSKILKYIAIGVLCAGYAAFFIAACIINFSRTLALLVITCVVIFFLAYDLFKKLFGKKILECLSPVGSCVRKNKKWMTWVFSALILIGLIAWLVVDTSKRPQQLISFGGVCFFIIVLFICSKHHRAVSWRAVFWGLGLQFALGLFIIRTDPGFQAFKFIGQQIQIFLNYTTAGSGFVFGENLIKDVFAFQALPIVVFFSCVMSVLYYVGLMQWLILKISWLMQITMGTTATETLSVAGNIFVGQTEAPLLIRPYLADMTKSEVHAVMTGGFGTIAGSVLGAYISFGLILSYVFMPVAFMMGVEWREAAMVGEMLGTKLILNEFVAYRQLAEYKDRRLSGVEEWIDGNKQWLSERAEIITTYALCGFANFSSIGIMLGGLASMAPERKGDFAKVVLRALMTGVCVSFVNACVAGILYNPRELVNCITFLNTTEAFNSTTYNLYTCCAELHGSILNLNGTLSFGGEWENVTYADFCARSCCGFYNHTNCAAW
ncbi:sodium/nucleoside cotransporter 2-like isoform X4 [Ascaphus truei]|uniref:sodium/nucleoside cotransporter 2-like isoform X4 n=1 Tax=Ascaphus truei TaxID=8439 RepID=UPI003F5ABA22